MPNKVFLRPGRSPGDHADPPPVLPALIPATRNLVRQGIGDCYTRWQFFDACDHSIERNGVETYAIYDARGKVIETRQQACSTGSSVIDGWLITRTLYDTQGRVEFTTDSYFVLGTAYPASADVAWSGTHNVYDNLGHVIRTELHSGVTIELVSDPNHSGQMMAQLRNGFDWATATTKVSEVQTFYDDLGRVDHTIDESGNETDYYYDQFNRLDHETDPLGHTTSYEYDRLGEVTRRSDRDGRVIDYGYDSFGRMTSETWSDGVTILRTMSYRYDARGRLESVSDPDATYTYGYNDLDQRTTVTVTVAGLTPTVVLVPIFPELRPHFEDVWEQAEPGTEYVITRYRDRNANLRTQLCRIIARAGLQPWEKLFQNLRATRATELVSEGWPEYKVCEWLGHTEAVAKKHYWQVTDEDYRRAAGFSGDPAALQIALQVSDARPCKAMKTDLRLRDRSADLARDCINSHSATPYCINSQMTPTGFEPVLQA